MLIMREKRNKRERQMLEAGINAKRGTRKKHESRCRVALNRPRGPKGTFEPKKPVANLE